MSAQAAPPPPSPAAPASMWTRRQDKLLELLIWQWRVRPGPRWRWEHIAGCLVDKTTAQVLERYARMAAEVIRVMEAPRVDTPPEWDQLQDASVANSAAPAGGDDQVEVEKVAAAAVTGDGSASAAVDAGAEAALAGKVRKNRKKRKINVGKKRNKSVKWSTEEHGQFLAGIDKYGKGKWQTLSREFVKTRSATQIASHFQKFCIRNQKRKLNQLKRASIHDITEPPTSTSPATADPQPSAAAAADDGGE